MTTPPLDEPFTAGRVVQRREVLHGHLWLTHPVTVVDDRGGVLAVLLEPGSPFTFPPHPFGPHPWSHQSAWGSTSVLQLHRGGNPYSVWRFFTDGVFTHWYVNLEAPIVRHPDATGGGAYDTDDHGIDIVVPADGSPWQWKISTTPPPGSPPDGSPKPRPTRSTPTPARSPTCSTPTKAGGPSGTPGPHRRH